jgi:hypothetical protein
MHFRRLACFLLGAWLACGLFMAMVATQNFRSVDRLLAHSAAPAAEQLGKLGPDAARALLRYQVSEQNRWYFETWEIAQIFIGMALLLVLLFGTTETAWNVLLALFMLLIVIVQRLVLTPEIVVLGRLIDFVPHGEPSPERARFWLLHGFYTSAELLKWILGLVLTVRLLLRHKHAPAHDPADFNTGRLINLRSPGPPNR